jgi:hypothetical protein
MRNVLIVLWMLLCSVTSATAQVSVGVWLPGVSIGINMPVYPTLVVVPGYPVYYAPQLSANYFFYDGMYWVFVGDSWYASSWYNGPWVLVEPVAVPVFILRVPVYYYRQPPVYFRAWSPYAPPRWGEHWGPAWQQRRSGWDNWNRSSVPAPAPLPVYQRQYEGPRYPRVEEQQALQSQHYRYQPRDTVVKQHYQAQRTPSAAAASPQRGKGASEERGATKRDPSDSGRSSAQQSAPPPRELPPQKESGEQKGRSEQKGGGDMQRSVTTQPPSRPGGAPTAQYQSPQSQQRAAQREQQAPRSQSPERVPQPMEPRDKGQQDKGQQDKGHDKGSAQEPRQGQEKGK